MNVNAYYGFYEICMYITILSLMGVLRNNVPGYKCGYNFLKFAMIIVHFLSGIVIWNIF